MDICNRVVLVDGHDREIGSEEKLKAHTEGRLHRAFSILVFNEKGEMLIHKRASAKYHCPGLWTNTCCSHPSPGEEILSAARRRLKEEMGFECGLEEKFSFIYKVKFENRLSEHEFDHVFVGHVKGDEINIAPDKKEVEEFRWIRLDELRQDIHAAPERYTFWFKEIMKQMKL